MITPKELTEKLRSIPEAKVLFDKMAELPLWDAAYFLLLYKYRFDDIQYRAGLQNAPFVDDPAAQPVQPAPYVGPRRAIVKFAPHELMFHRLKAVHPDATDGRLLKAIEAARELNHKAWPLMKAMADFSGLRAVARLREECPGFEQRTYEMAYYDFRVANR